VGDSSSLQGIQFASISQAASYVTWYLGNSNIAAASSSDCQAGIDSKVRADVWPVRADVWLVRGGCLAGEGGGQARCYSGMRPPVVGRNPQPSK
jgi:hypothetical protein